MQMAHAMGLRMVAEGVEDAETSAELVAMGVDVLQGIHIARPMIAADVGPWARPVVSAADRRHVRQEWSAGRLRSGRPRARRCRAHR